MVLNGVYYLRKTEKRREEKRWEEKRREASREKNGNGCNLAKSGNA